MFQSSPKKKIVRYDNMLGNLLGGFVTLLIGVNLLPVVADSVQESRFDGGNTSRPTNVTGASGTLVGLTTLFFSIGIMTAGLSIAFIGLKNAGVV